MDLFAQISKFGGRCIFCGRTFVDCPENMLLATMHELESASGIYYDVEPVEVLCCLICKNLLGDFAPRIELDPGNRERFIAACRAVIGVRRDAAMRRFARLVVHTETR